jgi:hypothetical protein
MPVLFMMREPSATGSAIVHSLVFFTIVAVVSPGFVVAADTPLGHRLVAASTPFRVRRVATILARLVTSVANDHMRVCPEHWLEDKLKLSWIRVAHIDYELCNLIPCVFTHCGWHSGYAHMLANLQQRPTSYFPETISKPSHIQYASLLETRYL